MRTEFEFIKDIKEKYRLDKVGDDCAVLPKSATDDLLITSDMLVEDIDFLHKWTKPELLGHKSLAVSLSDIAAMGGTPEYALIALALPEPLWKSDFLDRFYAGWHALAAEFAVEMVGGDVSRSPDKLVIDSTVLGSVSQGKAIVRSGAKPGDGIFVSGSLGGAAGGLKLFENDSDSSSQLGLKQLKPRPRLTLGKQLRDIGLVSAMIDISDGLAADLAHLCESSKVGAIIHQETIPLDPDLLSFFPQVECIEMAMRGGEDFELLFTGDRDAILSSGIPDVTLIGEITAESGILQIEQNGEVRPLEPHGYQHF